MPFEDSKPVKKEVQDDDEDGKSLRSVVKKKPPNANNATSSAAKARTKVGVKVKKEEPQSDTDDDFVRPIKSPPSGSRFKEAKPRKRESAEDEERDDDKPISRRNSSVKNEKEKEVKNKKPKKEELKEPVTSKTENGKKRERKVYDLPGQKRDPPEERDPLRLFYESLYKQIPTSAMAQIWMMESGLLPLEEAKKVLEMKQKKNPKFSSPVKSTSAARSTTGKTPSRREAPESPVSLNKGETKSKTISKPAKKRKNKDASSEDDDSEDEVIASRLQKKQKVK